MTFKHSKLPLAHRQTPRPDRAARSKDRKTAPCTLFEDGDVRGGSKLSDRTCPRIGALLGGPMSRGEIVWANITNGTVLTAHCGNAEPRGRVRLHYF
jgi:hypothetical protein